MNNQKPPFTVIQGGMGKTAPPRTGETISPDRPPSDLNDQELLAWDYICQQLRLAGIDHSTFGLAAVVVSKTYIGWLQAEKELLEVKTKNRGSYMTTTPNGHHQPHQIFYIARDLKRELLQWLPECALTIPSLATIRSKTGDQSLQDDLFGDLVNHANARPHASNG